MPAVSQIYLVKFPELKLAVHGKNIDVENDVNVHTRTQPLAADRTNRTRASSHKNDIRLNGGDTVLAA